MISDIFNKPVHVKNHAGSIGLGAFLVTATEMGSYNSLESAAQAVETPVMYQPSRKDHEVYMRYFSLFERLSAKLSDDFAEIARLQGL